MEKKYGTSLIIGNGFDLNLGMVTDYRSFFNKLNSDDFFAKHADNPLLQFIKAKGEKENWYDFPTLQFAIITNSLWKHILPART